MDFLPVFSATIAWMKQETPVKASEVGEYVYCKRAWWLTFNNLAKTTPHMQDGIERHDAFYLFLTSLKTRLAFAKLLVTLGIVLLLVSLLGMIFQMVL